MKRGTTVYLSGPMTGLPQWNYPKFHHHAAMLRGEGYKVLCPAENFDGNTELPRSQYMREDIGQVLQSDVIMVLPGWDKSKGARLEVAVAREIGLPVVDVVSRQPVPEDDRPETILEEAQRLVHGDRGVDYGHPIEDFARTGRMWGAILGTGDVPPEKVGLCMVALKISRECNRAKRDNLTDGAGYFETVSMIRQRQAANVVGG